MYVCICHALKEKDVRQSVQDGTRTAGQFFKSNGCKPECAKCVNCIKETITSELSATPNLVPAE